MGCSTIFKSGPPSVAAQSASQFLSIDLVCLDHSGNISDASVSALTSALKTVTLPSVVVDAETEEVVVNTNNRKKLTLQKLPISTTFAIFNSSTSSTPYLLSDPTQEEETLANSLVTI